MTTTLRGENHDNPSAGEPAGWWQRWWAPIAAGLAGLLAVGVGWLAWTAMNPSSPPLLTVSSVYTPPSGNAGANVYFTLSNTGGSADTLTKGNAEYQTATPATKVSVCATARCPGDATVTIPARSTVVFRAGGPHLRVTGVGPLTVGHPPLQLTLTFTHSGLVHILVPIGTPADLSENDVMNYGFMGHREPGMGGMGSMRMSGMGGS